MAVHTWVAIVLTALLLTAVVAFCAGWAAHTEFHHRYRTGRQLAREWESAETRRPLERRVEAPGHTEIHLHWHHGPTGQAWWPSWPPAPSTVVEGQVVRELPGGVG